MNFYAVGSFVDRVFLTLLSMYTPWMESSFLALIAAASTVGRGGQRSF